MAKIEDEFRGSYDEDTLKAISHVGKSQIPPRKGAKYGYQTSSPWHISGTLDITREIWFDHDFDQYWFAPLGRVFGVPPREVADLVTDVVMSEWGMTFEGKHIEDPLVEGCGTAVKTGKLGIVMVSIQKLIAIRFMLLIMQC
ncbi:hypothetical protein OGZ01_28700 [Vibrio harveyi]|nr:hypothetical protein [Vibrio harveyi]